MRSLLGLAGAGWMLAATLSAHASEDVEMLKRGVVAWSEQLRSFDGRYTLTRWAADADPQDATWPVRCAFQEGSRRLESDDGTGLLVDVLHGGRWSYRAASGSGNPASVGLNAGKWPYPPGAWLFPDEVLSQSRGGRTLRETLAEGETRLLRHDGRRVLSHRYPPGTGREHVDIWLDRDGLPERIEWCFRFGAAPDDGDNPFDPSKRLLREVFAFRQYIELDGVRYPAEVRREIYTNTPDMRGVIDTYRDGVLTYEEYARMLPAAAKDRSPWAVQTAALDVASARFNAALPDELFELTVLPGDVAVDAQSDQVLYHPHWHERLPWPAILVLAALLVVGAAGVQLAKRLE